MKPVCGSCVVELNPVATRFCCPSREILLAGILDRFVSPPAAPNTLAATLAPAISKNVFIAAEVFIVHLDHIFPAHL